MPQFIRKTLFSALAVLILLGFNEAARADSLVCNFGGDSLTSSNPADFVSGYFTIEVTGTTVSSTTLKISSASSGPTAPPAGSFVSQIAFSVSPNPSATSSKTVSNGGIVAGPVSGTFDFSGLEVTVGPNNQSLSPQGGFDVLVDLPTSNGGGARLSAGESITFTVNGLTGVDFDLTNGSGITVFAHIQGLSTPAGSAKVTCLPTEPQPVPEPGTMFLLGTGLAGVGAAVRRRMKAGRTE